MIVLHNHDHGERTISFEVVPRDRQLMLVVGYFKLYPDDHVTLHDSGRPRDFVVFERKTDLDYRVNKLEAFYHPIFNPMPEKD